MKLLKTVRADPSDTFVFERAAEPGEWAVSGAFAFNHADLASLAGKARAAYRGGFLGIESLGRSTLEQDFFPAARLPLGSQRVTLAAAVS